MNADLIRRANASLSGRGKPRLVFLRRAVSDAYYALFHRIALMCADELIGRSKQKTNAWRRIYRNLEHGRCKEEFRRDDLKKLSPTAYLVGKAFIGLQEARHAADYDPTVSYRRRADVQVLIDLASAAITSIDNLPNDVAQELSVILITKKRT